MSARRISRLLIANRGEIAARIARTARRLGIETVAVFSEADADAPHARAADLAVFIGAARPQASYANPEAIFAAARATGADAIHPGYGFLAEDADFAAACAERGITFVGPSPATMRALGDKSAAKRLLAGSTVPLLPGYDGPDQSDERLFAEAAALGAPVMIKASAGGGGRGMRLVTDLATFAEALASARSESLDAFGSASVLLERALIAPRHIEVQIFGDDFGTIVHLGERDCSVQRRHQNVIEESPSPFVGPELRERLTRAALAVGALAGYRNAGTVEFLVDGDGAFFFIEVNARLQVEHPVTEAVTGLDLVEWQLRVAAGEPLPLAQERIRWTGHAIEARLCAEDPENGFLPQAGRLERWRPSLGAGLRVDDGVAGGSLISPYYDSLLAKVVASGATRDEARARLVASLERTLAFGLATNRAALVRILESDAFARGAATTATLTELEASVAARAPSQSLADDLALAAALQYRRLAGTRYGEFGGWSTTQHPGTTVRLGRSGPETSLLVTGPPEAPCVRDRERRSVVRFAPATTPEALYATVDEGPRRLVDFHIGTFVEFAYGTTSERFEDRTHARAAGDRASALDGLLRAPMSGRVVRIETSEGALARSGTALVVLAAMKMEHHLTLPADVTTTVLHAALGAQVAAGDILLAYEVVPPGAAPG